MGQFRCAYGVPTQPNAPILTTTQQIGALKISKRNAQASIARYSAK